MQMLMKCADVSNPTKEWPIYSEWIDRITTEFYNQGDMEKQLGLPVSPFMNRDSPSTSSQKGFIEFIVYPLFEALEYWTPLKDLKFNLDLHRDKFCHDQKDQSPPTEKRKLKLRMDTLNLLPGAKSAGDMYSPPLSGRRASVQPRRNSVVAGLKSLALFHSRAQSTTALQLPPQEESEPK
jgi:hypothetical protein